MSYEGFKKECIDCYIPEEYILKSQIADAPEFLRRWFEYEYKQKVNNIIDKLNKNVCSSDREDIGYEDALNDLKEELKINER